MEGVGRWFERKFVGFLFCLLCVVLRERAERAGEQWKDRREDVLTVRYTKSFSGFLFEINIYSVPLPSFYVVFRVSFWYSFHTKLYIHLHPQNKICTQTKPNLYLHLQKDPANQLSLFYPRPIPSLVPSHVLAALAVFGLDTDVDKVVGLDAVGPALVHVLAALAVFGFDT